MKTYSNKNPFNIVLCEILMRAIALFLLAALLLFSVPVCSKEQKELKKQKDVNEMMSAIQSDDLFKVQFLIRHKFDINSRDANNQTPLMVAVDQERTELVKYLLDQGADVNAVGQDGITALMYAVFRDSVEIVRCLLDHGAAMHAQDKEGNSVLMHALIGKSLPIKKLLLERGADVHARNASHQTPLMRAAELGDVESADLFLQHGAKLEDVDDDLRTALSYASRKEMLEFLISRGAKVDANQVTNDGRTLLHLAAVGCDTDKVEILLRYRPKLELKTLDDSDTPLLAAAMHGCLDVVKLLVQHGADVQAKDKQGKTAYQLASDNNIKEYLREYMKKKNLPIPKE